MTEKPKIKAIVNGFPLLVDEADEANGVAIYRASLVEQVTGFFDIRHFLVLSGLTFTVLPIPLGEEFHIYGTVRIVTDDGEPRQEVDPINRIREQYEPLNSPEQRDIAILLQEIDRLNNIVSRGHDSHDCPNGTAPYPQGHCDNCLDPYWQTEGPKLQKEVEQLKHVIDVLKMVSPKESK